MKATCENCGTTFRGVERGEDGHPEIENVMCADPRCEIFLCKAGCRHLSFHCDGCGERFCLEHKVDLDGLDFCLSCAAKSVRADEPPCRCKQTDRALFDPALCPFHDEKSEWNVRLREITAMQQLDELAVA